MEYERNGASLTWVIDGGKYTEQLYSPVFFLDMIDGTKWKLKLNRTEEVVLPRLSLIIKREVGDSGPRKIDLYYQFSINGLKLDLTRTTFKKKQKDECRVSVRISQIVTSDTVIIRCKLWIPRVSISSCGYFFTRTLVRTESYTFQGEVENFSTFSFRTLKTLLSSTGERVMTVHLTLYFCPNSVHTAPNTILVIKITPHNRDEQFYNLKLFVLDSLGNKTDFGKFETQFKLSREVYLKLYNISKEYILENAKQYLMNDTLSLHGEFTFCSGIEYENIERTEYETDCDVKISQDDILNAVKEREDTPCDMKFQTNTETFSVHTNLMSAQSPVFEAMFRSNMKEAIQKCVHIDDVDAETMKRMLLFLYSDRFQVFEWKNVMKLYVAADKYQVLSLKQKCEDILKKSIDLSNCCILLLLSHTHQDEKLQRRVQDYISNYNEEVFYCDQWINLEKDFPHLAIKVLRGIFLKPCRKNINPIIAYNI